MSESNPNDPPGVVVGKNAITVDPAVAALAPLLGAILGIFVDHGLLTGQEALTLSSALAVAGVMAWRWYASRKKTAKLVSIAKNPAVPDDIAKMKA